MFIQALSLGDAMDIVDAYGPDADLWPNKDRGALDALLNSNEHFADYVRDVKRIEDMLANWDEDWDGVDVGEDFDPEGRGGSDRDDDEPEERDAEFGDSDDEEDNAGPGASGEDNEEDEGEQPVIIIDPTQLKDMEGMLADAILKFAEDSDPEEFRIFTRDYDDMVDIVAPDDTSLAEIDQAVALSTGALQKDLRRLIAAQTQAKRIPGQRKGRLHGPNLHRILSGDDRVFTRREEAEKLDTAISLVVDCSGSMAGEQMKLATEAAYALGTVLNRLGVSFECLGFTDNHNDARTKTKEYEREVQAADDIATITRAIPISMPKFKTFEERWVQPVQRRFGRVFNANGGYGCGIDYGSTPEGCGMEFAARRLLGRKEKRKIMIVMTDGEPCGSVYVNPSKQLTPNDYARFRTAYQKRSVDMVRAIEAAGVDLIGIGIQHDGPTKYYPNAMVINDLSEMPRQLMALLKKFMLGK